MSLLALFKGGGGTTTSSYVGSGSLGTLSGTATTATAYIHPYAASGSLGTVAGTATTQKVGTAVSPDWVCRKRNGTVGFRRWRTTLIRE